MSVKFEKVDEGKYLLDVTGYVCPHPQMYTKKVLGKIDSGDCVELVFDNPSSGESIESMCESQGSELIQKDDEGGTYRWKICKL